MTSESDPHGSAPTQNRCLPEDRDAIVNAWHAPLHNLWGSTELGVQAVGCGLGPGLHICEDEVILERVDGNGAPVAPDEPAVRTLATGLSNRTFPFIRYDLGDEITMMSEPCACGSAFARVADISGRRDDDFVYGSHTVPASAFRHVLGTDPRIVEYQVLQTEQRRGRAGGRETLMCSRSPRRWSRRCSATALPTRRFGYAQSRPWAATKPVASSSASCQSRRADTPPRVGLYSLLRGAA